MTTPFLNTHLQQKIANRQWVEACLNGQVESFPYRIKDGGKAEFGNEDFLYDPNVQPKRYLKGKPVYLVNIPCAYQNMKTDPNLLHHLIHLFETESAGINSYHGRCFAQSRFALVIGVNHPHSIDPSRNLDFETHFAGEKIVSVAAFQILGFYWHPVWEKTSPTKHLLQKEVGYLLLKALKKEAANAVLEHVEGLDKISTPLKSQIPYQGIRERIRRSTSSSHFASHFERVAPKSPMYFGTMDADTLSIKRAQPLFSALDQAIVQHQSPSVIGCGYAVSDEERPIIQLGILIDMMVREAMTRIIKYSAYLPEPCLFVCIRHPPGSNILKQLSFIGAGNNLESRRLIQNARLKKLFNDRVVFIPMVGVIMGTPNRMKTLKNGRVNDLTPELLRQKQYLKSLRDVSQTHATPKQWADNLYLALDLRAAQVTDVTQHLMHIFSIYDPISRALNTLERFSSKTLDTIMETYDGPLSPDQLNLLATAKEALRSKKVPEAKIELVVTAAQESGRAIYTVLASRLIK